MQDLSLATLLRASGASVQDCLLSHLALHVPFQQALLETHRVFNDPLALLDAIQQMQWRGHGASPQDLAEGLTQAGIHPLSLALAAPCQEEAMELRSALLPLLPYGLPEFSLMGVGGFHHHASVQERVILDRQFLHNQESLLICTRKEVRLCGCVFLDGMPRIMAPELRVISGSDLREIISFQAAPCHGRSIPGVPRLEISDLDHLERIAFTNVEEISISRCPKLEDLGMDSKAGQVLLWDLPSLRVLPEKFADAEEVFLSGCPSLRLPESVNWKSLRVTNLTESMGLPTWPNSTPGGRGPNLILNACQDLTWLRGLTGFHSVAILNSDLKALPLMLEIQGDLRVEGCTGTHFPEDYQVGGEVVLDNLPDMEAPPTTITCGGLIIERCPKLRFPFAWKAPDQLILEGLDLECLPRGLSPAKELTLSCCGGAGLPSMINTWSLKVMNCWELASLPEDLQVHHLEVLGCPSLKIPESFWSRPGLSIVVEDQ